METGKPEQDADTPISQESQGDPRDARRQREEALHALARGVSDQSSPATMSAPHTRPGGPAKPGMARRVALIAVAIAIILGALAWGLLGHRQGQGSASATPTSFRIDLGSFGYSCPSAMAWSPDGKMLAVLAQKGKLDQAGTPCWSNTVLLLDTRRSVVLKSFDLTHTLSAANASLTQYALSWSPDGATIGLPCMVASPSPTGGADQGALLVPVNGGQPRILHPSVDQPHGEMTTVWDVQTGTLASASAYPLPPALRYQIDAAGHVRATQPAPAQSDVNTFTDSPTTTADGSFSVWQPGALVSVANGQADTTIFYSSSVGVWSADGRYFAPTITQGSVGFPENADALKAFDAEACATVGLTPCVSQPVSYPDRALMVVKNKLLMQSGAQPYMPDAPVAWRPDGRVLAAIFPVDSFTQHNDTLRVTLLSTRNGSVLATLSTQVSSSVDTPPFNDLAWSSSGGQLALRDTYDDAIILWGGSSLASLRP